MEGIIASPSKSFFVYCLSCLFGVASVSLLEIGRIDILYLSVGIMVPIFFLLLFWKDAKTRFLSIALLCLLLGVARYSLAVSAHATIIDSEEPFVATVVSEPDVRIGSVKYIVEHSGGERIYVSSDLYPRYQYGDTVEMECEIEKPESFDDFRYDMYLASRRVFLTCNRPSIKLVQGEIPSNFFRSLFVFKARVAEQINRLWPEPYASFMAGLLYGYRGGLGTLQEQFNITGVTHIVAISGYNITIISTILLSLLISLRVRRQRAFWIVVCGIAVFVLFVGASASVVRAGIMGVLVLMARQMGRLSHIGNVLILTAVLMTLWNPYVLLWDAGFQLSFLATLGLIYIAPWFEKYCKKVPETFGLRESIVATLAATVATLPLILFQFGRLSIVSPIVNVLILPFIPFIMAVGFFATTASFVLFPLGQFIGFIAWGGMAYIVVIVRWFAELPFAAVEVMITAPVMMIGYVILGYIVKKNRRHEHK